MRGGLVEQQEGRRPIAATREALRRGEDQADQQRLLLAGRGILGRHGGGAVDDREIGAVRAFQRAPGLLVDPAHAGPLRGQHLLDFAKARAGDSHLLGFAFQGEIGLGEGAFGAGIDGGLQALQHQGATDGKLRAGLGHARFDGIGPGRIDILALQQGIALAHGLFIAHGGRAMGGQVGHHLPVEKAPPVARRAPEHAIHGRRQPDNADEICEIRRRGILAIDAHGALVARAGRVEADTDTPVFQVARDGPAARRAMAGQFTQRRRAQAPARPELADRFQQVRLARAIGAVKADMPAIQREVELGIIAEIGEAQAREGGHFC